MTNEEMELFGIGAMDVGSRLASDELTNNLRHRAHVLRRRILSGLDAPDVGRILPLWAHQAEEIRQGVAEQVETRWLTLFMDVRKVSTTMTPLELLDAVGTIADNLDHVLATPQFLFDRSMFWLRLVDHDSDQGMPSTTRGDIPEAQA